MNAAESTVSPLAISPGEPILSLTRNDGFFEFDRQQAKAAGEKLATQYQSNQPYPHIVIDNIFDRSVLQQVNREFPQPKKGRFSDEFSQLKTGYLLDMIRSAYIQDLLTSLNSAGFLNFLERMTGIKGLVPDPRFVGGGLHESRRGGHLSIHADFNIHPIMRLRRRLNVILFLNEGWDAEWGGALELWNRSMTECVHKVLPELGRAVIFNTDSSSYHGHPDPLTCPDTVTRRSIALYYYTVPDRMQLAHTTKWRKRPGSADQVEPLKKRVSYMLHHYFGKHDAT